MITWIPTIVKSGTPSSPLLARTGSGGGRGRGGTSASSWPFFSAGRSLLIFFLLFLPRVVFPPCKLTLPHFMPRADLGLPAMERNHFPLPWVHITSSKRRQTQQLYKLFKPVEECSFVTVAVEGAGFILFFSPIRNGNLKSDRKNTASDPTHFSVWLAFVCGKSCSISTKSFSEEENFSDKFPHHFSGLLCYPPDTVKCLPRVQF